MEQLVQLDLRLFNLINHTLVNPVFDWACPHLRSKGVMACFYIGIAYGVFKNYRHQFLQIVIAGAITYLLTDQLAASVIKPIFERVRPCNNSTIGARLLIENCGGGFSFVSAHAANVFGTASLILIALGFKQKVLVGLFSWATAVCFSQVYVGVHYPADVLCGALLGIVLGAAGAVVLRRIKTN